MPADRRSGAALELTGLRALAAVTTRTLAGAAADLGVTPATVLGRIRRLESATGRPLLEPGSARPNAAGRLLAEHAEAISAALAAARADLHALASGHRATLRLGIAADVPERLAGALIAELAAQRGDLRCATTEVENRSAALAALTAAEYEAVLVPGPPSVVSEGIVCGAVLVRDPWVLLVAAGSPLAESGAPVDGEVVRALTRVRGTGAVAQALVAAGLGVAVLPRSDVDVGHPATVAIDLGHLMEPVAFSLVWSSGAEVGALREAAARTGARIDARRAVLADVLA